MFLFNENTQYVCCTILNWALNQNLIIFSLQSNYTKGLLGIGQLLAGSSQSSCYGLNMSATSTYK